MRVLEADYRTAEAPKQFVDSLRDTGFAIVSNHPIPLSLIQQVYGEWEQFFVSDSKFDYLYDKKSQAGYFPFKSENAKDSPEKDLKEFYHLYDRKTLPQTLSEKTFVLRNALFELGKELLSWIDELSPPEVRKKFSAPLKQMSDGSPKNLFRVIHYPPIQDSDAGIRAAAHEDINLITLLPGSTAMGLQVKDSLGNWHDIPAHSGDIVVNVGDMLQEASGGYYRSTTHRVINPDGELSKSSRYSMPLFVHPHDKVRLSDRYTAGEYLDQRLREIGLSAE